MPGAAKGPSRKSLVLEYLELHRPAELTPEVLAEIRRHILERTAAATVSTRYVLDLAEGAGVPVARQLGGIPLDLVSRIHFHDYAAAEASLRDLEAEHTAADSLRAQDCRRAVLRARRRLESMLRRPSLSPEKRAEREEILSWVRVWLETPDLFPAWLDLRKRALDRS